MTYATPNALSHTSSNAPSLSHARKDLHGTRKDLLVGASTSAAEMARSIDLARSPACKNVFLTTCFDVAQASANRAGIERTPLAGLAISIKDLFDVAGETTKSGSIVLADAPKALADCTAVARLKAAGGSILGRTNMVEFAFSGVGTNPHYGTPANAADGMVARVPGGSSSGGVVSVATGAAFIGLGSDTGGSVRIPAALNGVVGFKCTARRVPTQGAYPLSTSMDTVCAMTRSVRDAILAHEILSGHTVCKSYAPLAGYRLAVATTQMQDALEPPVAKAWQHSLDRLRQMGASIVDIALPELLDLPGIVATGGLSPAESYAWHYPMLQTQSHRYDPRVLTRIQRGANMSARDYIDLLTARRQWIARMETALAPFDAVLSPTVPVVAPAIADVAPGAERDEAFFALNGKLLRNTSVVNMLDGCAISIPCHQPGDLPVGLMVWGPAMQDDTVLNIALQIEQILQYK
jgi:aspartyl-tRNA(Asn)/glutamyl-tRNA(Gln) amidotransferase subunit A